MIEQQSSTTGVCWNSMATRPGLHKKDAAWGSTLVARQPGVTLCHELSFFHPHPMHRQPWTLRPSICGLQLWKRRNPRTSSRFGCIYIESTAQKGRILDCLRDLQGFLCRDKNSRLLTSCSSISSLTKTVWTCNWILIQNPKPLWHSLLDFTTLHKSHLPFLSCLSL